jgi:hypothetical protein
MIRGTIKQLDGKIVLNGNALSAPQLSTLFKLGDGTFCKKVGTAPKPDGQKGRAAAIWEVDPSVSVSLSVK